VAAGGVLESLPQIGAFLPEEPALFPSLWTLRKKFQTLGQRARQHREIRRLVYQLQRNAVPVEEMIRWLEARLAHLPPGEWTPATPLFAEAGALARQVTLFQAVLELARHSLALEQTGEFAFSLSKRVSEFTGDRRIGCTARCPGSDPLPGRAVPESLRDSQEV
jgi:hypothetical protein